MYQVKIFLNNRGEPEKFQKDINTWFSENKIYIKTIKYAMTYDAALDDYVMSALILYKESE